MQVLFFRTTYSFICNYCYKVLNIVSLVFPNNTATRKAFENEAAIYLISSLCLRTPKAALKFIHASCKGTVPGNRLLSGIFVPALWVRFDLTNFISRRSSDVVVEIATISPSLCQAKGHESMEIWELLLGTTKQGNKSEIDVLRFLVWEIRLMPLQFLGVTLLNHYKFNLNIS